MYDYAGKTFLVTGSSGGIGLVFARALAAKKAHLVLVARTKTKLDALASELRAAHGVTVTPVVEDLGRPGAAKRVHDAITRAGIAVDVLVNNAGLGVHGGFEDLTLAEHRETIDLNVTALVELTHVFIAELLERKGGVINVSSIAAFQPIPFFSTYAASKAFVQSFSEALWGEYRKRGLRVLALCPGATDTGFFVKSGDSASGGQKRVAPERVVQLGLRAFASNRSYAVDGVKNYLLVNSGRLVPRATIVKIAAAMAPPPERRPAR
jgi:short-subunit dehydrogenase